MEFTHQQDSVYFTRLPKNHRLVLRDQFHFQCGHLFPWNYYFFNTRFVIVYTKEYTCDFGIL